MGQIRRQTILSSIIIYVGFFIGLVNTYFFVKNGAFTPAEYGLTRIFFDIGQTFSSLASFAIPALIYKFYPVHNAHFI